MQGEVPAAVVEFLELWYNDADSVQGYTSGSTGAPKPIKLLKSDMRASARLTNHYLGIDSHSTLLLCLSPSYIAGKMMIVRALEARASLLVVEPSSTPLQNLDTSITLAAMVPMQVSETLQQKDGAAQLSRIEQLLIGGAPVLPALENRLKTLTTHTYITYGMTETVSHVALRRPGDDCYDAIGDVSFEVDKRGCLVIDAPQLSERRFVTNDMVSLDSERRFRWLGRYDNVIMSGGLKFCAEELEKKITSVIPSRYYITAAPDERLGQHIVLVIESLPYNPVQEEKLREQLSQILSRYEMPREIKYMSRFEETYSGKIKRL